MACLLPIHPGRCLVLGGTDGVVHRSVGARVRHQARRRAGKEWLPCKINKVWQVFPYNLMGDYASNSKQPSWFMSVIRDPVDRVSPSPVRNRTTPGRGTALSGPTVPLQFPSVSAAFTSAGEFAAARSRSLPPGLPWTK